MGVSPALSTSNKSAAFNSNTCETGVQNSVCKIYVKDHFTYKNKHVILHCTVKIKNMTFIMRQKENVYKKMQEKEQTDFTFLFLGKYTALLIEVWRNPGVVQKHTKR